MANSMQTVVTVLINYFLLSVNWSWHFPNKHCKTPSRRVFPFPTKLGWKLDWKLKAMSSWRTSTHDCFHFLSVGAPANRLSAVHRWYVSGWGRVSLSDKMRQRWSHSLTSAIISHWANGLQLQWLGSRSFFLLTGRAAATAHCLRNGVLLHPFRVKNGAQWNHVTELTGCPPQILTRWPCPPGNCRFIIGSASIVTAVTSVQLGWIIEDHYAVWQGRWWSKLWWGSPLPVAPHRAADRERVWVYEHTAAPFGLTKKEMQRISRTNTRTTHLHLPSWWRYQHPDHRQWCHDVTRLLIATEGVHWFLYTYIYICWRLPK